MPTRYRTFYADSNNVRADFRLFDSRGRAIGAEARTFTRRAGDVVECVETTLADGRSIFVDAEHPGIVASEPVFVESRDRVIYGARPQAIRDGRGFGASNAERHFDTAEERDAYVVAYFTGAAKRYAKAAGRTLAALTFDEVRDAYVARYTDEPEPEPTAAERLADAERRHDAIREASADAKRFLAERAAVADDTDRGSCDVCGADDAPLSALRDRHDDTIRTCAECAGADCEERVADESYRVIARYDTSAASAARERFARTGEKSSPWHSKPERESFEEYEIRRYDDGTEITASRRWHTWAGTANAEPWRVGDRERVEWRSRPYGGIVSLVGRGAWLARRKPDGLIVWLDRIVVREVDAGDVRFVRLNNFGKVETLRDGAIVDRGENTAPREFAIVWREAVADTPPEECSPVTADDVLASDDDLAAEIDEVNGDDATDPNRIDEEAERVGGLARLANVDSRLRASPKVENTIEALTASTLAAFATTAGRLDSHDRSIGALVERLAAVERAIVDLGDRGRAVVERLDAVEERIEDPHPTPPPAPVRVAVPPKPGSPAEVLRRAAVWFDAHGIDTFDGVVDVQVDALYDGPEITVHLHGERQFAAQCLDGTTDDGRVFTAARVDGVLVRQILDDPIAATAEVLASAEARLGFVTLRPHAVGDEAWDGTTYRIDGDTFSLRGVDRPIVVDLDLVRAAHEAGLVCLGPVSTEGDASAVVTVPEPAAGNLP